MVSASIVSVVHWFTVTSIDEELFGSLCEAIASVEAEFSEKWDSLEVDNHVFHEFEFSDQSFFLISEVISAHGRVHVKKWIFEFSEKLIFLIFVK